MMETEDKTLFCFCHWGKRNKVLPDGSIWYGGGITDQVIAKTGVKYDDFVIAVFDRLGIDASDKMLLFTVKFDGTELIRLKDQTGIDTMLQFNDGYAHVYASSLEKESDSRPPSGGTKNIGHTIASDKTLFCFCHWGKRNKVLPDGSISYGGDITDQVIAKTGIKYNAFVKAVFDRLGIDPSDKMLHFTVKFDRSELIRLRDQEGVDTFLQCNDGHAHVYASSLEKEPCSRPPPGGKKPIIACYARRPKQSQPGGQDMPLESNINKPFEQRELPNQGTSKTTAVSDGFPPTQTGSQQGPEICSTNFICDAQLSNLNHHKYTQPTSSAMQETFWTQCPSCKLMYKYYCTYVNRILRCSKCSNIFTAYNLGCGPKRSQPGGQDVPLKSNLNQPSELKELPNQEKVDCTIRKRFRKQIVESSETNDTSVGVETEDGNNPPSGQEIQLDGYQTRRSS